MLHSPARRFRRVRASRCLPVYSFLLYANNNKITPSECHEKPPRGPPRPLCEASRGAEDKCREAAVGLCRAAARVNIFLPTSGSRAGGSCPSIPAGRWGLTPPPPNTHQPFPSPRRASRGQRGGWDFRLGVWLWVFCSFPPSPAL